MSLEKVDRSGRYAKVECADHSIYAGGCEDRVSIFVPVMGQTFRWLSSSVDIPW
jgi:hypothetical protein